MTDSSMRAYVKGLLDIDLALLWRESIDWEDKGVLPLEAEVRSHVRTLMGERHDMMSFIIVAPTFFAEVWREVACRETMNHVRDSL